MASRRIGDFRPFALAIIVAATVVTAVVGARASLQAATFYAELTRPAWAPPPAVFGPVWTVLYVLIAAAAYLVVLRAPDRRIGGAITLWGVQLVLNAAWTWLFFGLHSGAGALVDIFALVIAVAATLVAFWRIRPLAGVLLVPYGLWVGFASALTIAVYSLNRGVL